MSNEREKERLIAYVETYKQALPDQAQDPVAMPMIQQAHVSGIQAATSQQTAMMSAKAAMMPNDAARAKGAIRTRERRYGASKLSSQGKASLSSK